MEPFKIIVMEKDMETGFLQNEIAGYSIEKDADIIGGIYAVRTDSGYDIVIRLTTERDLKDWEFAAVFDYYDASSLEKLAKEVVEDPSYFNPVWQVRLEMLGDDKEMEELLQQLVSVHVNELRETYEAINDKKDDYSEFDEKPHMY